MSAESLLKSDESIALEILMRMFEKNRTVKKDDFVDLLGREVSAERLIRLGIKRLVAITTSYPKVKAAMSIVRKNGEVIYVGKKRHEHSYV